MFVSFFCIGCLGLWTGITNDPKDPSVDTFRSSTLPMLKRFGVPAEGLDLKIESRGVPPHGGGEISLSIPSVQCLSVSFRLICSFLELLPVS